VAFLGALPNMVETNRCRGCVARPRFFDPTVAREGASLYWDQTLTRFQGITILHRHPSRGSCRSAVLSSAEAPAKAAPKRTLPYRFRPHVWLYFLSRSRTHWLRWDAFCSGVSIQRTAGRQRPYKPVTVALANVWKCRSNPTSAAEAASFLASGSLSTSTAKTVIW
jgi:hypothetical protein